MLYPISEVLAALINRSYLGSNSAFLLNRVSVCNTTIRVCDSQIGQFGIQMGSKWDFFKSRCRCATPLWLAK